MPVNPKQFFYGVLINPNIRYRIVRYAVMWTTALLLIYRGFHFLATTAPSPSQESIIKYSLLATSYFGLLTVVAYFVITTLTQWYILTKFELSYFIAGVCLTHLLASELVLIHFDLFYALFPLAQLPRLYHVNEVHLKALSYVRAPFDGVIVWLFSFSLFYNYLLYAVSFKVFKDLFSIQIQKTELEKEVIQLEFNFLKAQINPHFLFNTLNNLYSFAIRSPEKVADLLLKLADLMRYTLYETSEERVLLTKELSFLQSYVDLQRIRHDDHVSIRFIVEGTPTHQLIPPLILIVLVENAFKHGPESTAKASWVTIQLNINTNCLTLRVENSVTELKKTSPAGLGLANIRKRLAYSYPGQHTLVVQEKPNQYSVRLTISLNEAAL
jgi:sensor histidine kinase YesM